MLCLGPGGILPMFPDSLKLLSSVQRCLQECFTLNYEVLLVRSLCSAVKTLCMYASFVEFVVSHFLILIIC